MHLLDNATMTNDELRDLVLVRALLIVLRGRATALACTYA